MITLGIIIASASLIFMLLSMVTGFIFSAASADEGTGVALGIGGYILFWVTFIIGAVIALIGVVQELT